MEIFNDSSQRRRRRRRTDDTGDDGPVPAPTFLGTLRSELDVEGSLPAEFSSLHAAFEAALGAYHRHDLTKVGLAEKLAGLRCLDSDRVEWTLGASSLQWYRRQNDGTWGAAAPPLVGGDTLDVWAPAASVPGVSPVRTAPAGPDAGPADPFAETPPVPVAPATGGGWPAGLQPPSVLDSPEDMAAPGWEPPRRVDAGEDPETGWELAPRSGSDAAEADLDSLLTDLGLPAELLDSADDHPEDHPADGGWAGGNGPGWGDNEGYGDL